MPKYGDTSMEELLDAALSIIQEVNERITCRCVLVECKEASECDSPQEKTRRGRLHKKYTDYGFVPLQKDGDLVQYIMIL